MTYTYDSLNQLVGETHSDGSSKTYTYDIRGNLLSKTDSPDGETTTTVSYTYGDSVWKDRLTAFDGAAVSYDEIGNPTQWHTGAAMTWQHGRRLASYVDATNTISYAYNADGVRTAKTVNGQTTTYTVVDGTLRRLTVGADTLQFVNGTSVIFNGTEYWYIYNAQGDVIGLIDNTGTYVVQYTYDAWGKPLSKTGTLADTLGTLNPFRYRGYIYDEESGFYYVSSRYYDPAIGRWLNADSVIAGVGGDLRAYNAFAYCFNNPINYLDVQGNYPENIQYWWTASMWWLTMVDGVLPIGDAIYGVGVLVTVGVSLVAAPLICIMEPVSSTTVDDSISIPNETVDVDIDEKVEEKVETHPTTPKNEGVTYYHVTTPDAALSIMLSGAMIGSRYEGGYVYAWKSIPSQYARDNSGAHFGVVISFKTNASFTRDTGISDLRVAAYGPVVTTRPGPITVWDVKILG